MLLLGAAAGAVGSVALNAVTYLDMTGRGRPASETPAEVAGRLAETGGVEALSNERSDEAAANRREGAGALLGILTGVAVGAVWGLLRSLLGRVPAPVAAAGVGVAAMTLSDLPATVLGVTDPREWDAASWAADVVPHLAYGAVTVLALEAFLRGEPGKLATAKAAVRDALERVRR